MDEAVLENIILPAFILIVFVTEQILYPLQQHGVKKLTMRVFK